MARNDKFTLIDFQRQFPNEDACISFLFHKLYNNKCPHCGKENTMHRISTRRTYSCHNCRKHTHVTAGTIFHKSPTPLTIWFQVIYMISVSKNGVSAKEIERTTGVTYKTAWRMLKQIQKLFDDEKDNDGKGGGLLSGIIEVDETYYGGKAEGKRGRGADNKTPIVGIVQRLGNLFAKVVCNTKSSTVIPLVNQRVEIGSIVNTDEYMVYDKLSSLYFNHKRVNHGNKQFVNGDIHTNTIEGFWSYIKRAIDGTFHAVSPKYLQQYLNQFIWYWNCRGRKPRDIFGLIVERV